MYAHVGIDVSKEKLDVCYLIDSKLVTFKRIVVDNTEKGHKQLLRWLKKETKQSFNHIQVTLEATGVYHLNLAYFLQAKQLRVCVTHPLHSKHYAISLSMRAKTDRLDSIMLSRYGAERNLPEWQPAPKELVELKALNVRLTAVEKDIRREQNRLESAVIANHSKAVIRLNKQSIRQLQKQAETLVELIDELIESHEQLRTNRRLLETIKGIGEVTSRHLVAEIYSGRFHNAGQCAAYMGLVPVPQQSGKFESVHLSRAGNRSLKAKLYMAAISAKQHNPVLKAHYDKLIARGKCKMSALCAVMRRLVQISFGVIKHQKEFCLPA